MFVVVKSKMVPIKTIDFEDKYEALHYCVNKSCGVKYSLLEGRLNWGDYFEFANTVPLNKPRHFHVVYGDRADIDWIIDRLHQLKLFNFQKEGV